MSNTSGATPNRGHTVRDVVAKGNDVMAISEWKSKRGINDAARVNILKIAHMRYQHPDLDQITTFLTDFGMTIAKRADNEIWFKGYGDDQYVYYAKQGPKQFLGGTFAVASLADLEKAAKLPGASPMTDLANAPGGGQIVTVHDPEGFPINFMFGQEPAVPGQVPEKLVVNFEDEKPRKKAFQRFSPGPAAVHKLGHYGLCIRDYEGILDWYTKNFNLIPSDILYVPVEAGRKDVAAFLHIDLGTTLVDHHTFFFSSNKTAHVHHASFEVHDFDTQALGHQWLQKKGYKSVWGVGRHILGSQIFDYWWDTTGNMIEHYADGDLVDEDTPIGFGPAGDESLAIWGPEVPSYFLD